MLTEVVCDVTHVPNDTCLVWTVLFCNWLTVLATLANMTKYGRGKGHGKHRRSMDTDPKVHKPTCAPWWLDIHWHLSKAGAPLPTHSIESWSNRCPRQFIREHNRALLQELGDILEAQLTEKWERQNALGEQQALTEVTIAMRNSAGTLFRTRLGADKVFYNTKVRGSVTQGFWTYKDIGTIFNNEDILLFMSQHDHRKWMDASSLLGTLARHGRKFPYISMTPEEYKKTPQPSLTSDTDDELTEQDKDRLTDQQTSDGQASDLEAWTRHTPVKLFPDTSSPSKEVKTELQQAKEELAKVKEQLEKERTDLEMAKAAKSKTMTRVAKLNDHEKEIEGRVDLAKQHEQLALDNQKKIVEKTKDLKPKHDVIVDNIDKQEAVNKWGEQKAALAHGDKPKTMLTGVWLHSLVKDECFLQCPSKTCRVAQVGTIHKKQMPVQVGGKFWKCQQCDTELRPVWEHDNKRHLLDMVYLKGKGLNKQAYADAWSQHQEQIKAKDEDKQKRNTQTVSPDGNTDSKKKAHKRQSSSDVPKSKRTRPKVPAFEPKDHDSDKDDIDIYQDMQKRPEEKTPTEHIQKHDDDDKVATQLQEEWEDADYKSDPEPPQSPRSPPQESSSSARMTKEGPDWDEL